MNQTSSNTSHSGSTAEQLLDAAQTLIQKNGYNGFSYEDLSRLVGLKKPSIHHHFPRKEDLGASVVRRYTNHYLASLDVVTEANANPVQRLKGYIKLFSDTYGPARKLCPGGILGAESDTLPTAVAVAVKKFFEINIEWLAELLDDARRNGHMNFDGTPADQALFFFSSLEGSMVVGRGLRDSSTVTRVGTALVSHLTSLPSGQ